MRLNDLVGVLDEVELVDAAEPTRPVDETEVTSVAYDSRQVTPGALFCALPGQLADGRSFAAAAVDAGAVAVLAEARIEVPIPQVVVPDARHAMGVLAAELEGNPSRQLSIVGITGTNGKTTTAHLVAHLLDQAGHPAGIIGTLTGARTTPEAPDLQARLRAYRDGGAVAVAMEVSSHALRLRRVDGTRFTVAVFTNLGRDHLDFHETMEDYFHAKAQLFTAALTDDALVNVDDPYGRLLLEAATVPTRGVGLGDVDEVLLGRRGSTFRWRGRRVRLPMAGEFNVRNALLALEVGVELAVEIDALAAGLESVPPVPGRFELVDRGQPFSVVVDYAHTPDGLEAVLRSARGVAGPGKVTVVFGCGGDRDVAKRPAMGEVASRLADQVFLTSDNPRGEAPQEIIDDVKAGITSTETLVVDPDRRAAIHAAIDGAIDGDVVVIAGKGHETTQTIAGVETPFDDRLEAADALADRGWSGS